MSALSRVAALVLAAVALPPAAAAAARPVTLLAPAGSAAPVNAGSVRVEALLRAPRAVLAVDGRRVALLRAGCAEAVVTATVPVSALPDGLHVVAVRAGGSRARAAVVLDRTAAARTRNRVEQAAAARPFRCLSRDRLVLQPGRAIAPEERIVLWQGGTVRELSAQALGLHKTGPREYRFRRLRPPFALRIGNDWGGLDAAGRRLARLGAPTGPAAAAATTIGPGGGTVETVDGLGVGVRLTIPPGALDRDTPIRIVPLATAPLAGASPAQLGLRFEPDGLVFRTPALLTLDYSRTSHTVSGDEQISLVTSPLTALPLPGSADPAAGTVTAELPHFSETVGGLDELAFSDLQAWADPILASTAAPTLAEIASLFALMQEQQAAGCVEHCIDPAAVTAKADVAVGTLDREACTLDIAAPSDVAFERWLNLSALAEGVGGNGSAATACAEAVLRALILDAPDELDRLLELLRRAQALGSGELQDLAGSRVDAILRAEIGDRRALCSGTPDNARVLLAETRDRAGLLGRRTVADEAQAAIEGCHGAPAPAPAPAAPPAPPAPVPATGCAADIAGPTDGAIDSWHAIEVSAPAGADVSAVRTCVGSIFSALVQAAVAAAGSSPTDAQLQRFVDLSAHATATGYPASSTAALQALGTILRAMLAAGAALCPTDAAAATAALDRVIAWAPRAASVEASLLADAQQARSTCQAPPQLSVLIRTSGGPGWTTFVNATVTQAGPTLANATSDFRTLGSNQSPPLTFAAALGGNSAAWDVSQPAPDTLDVDSDVFIDGSGPNGADLGLFLDLTAYSAGTLTLSWQDAWTPSPLGSSAGMLWLSLYYTDDSGTWVWERVDPGNRPSQLDHTFTVAAGQTRQIWVRIGGNTIGMSTNPVYYDGTGTSLSAGGRLLTITLTH